MIVGEESVLYGQVGIANNVVLGKGTKVLAKSGVSKSLEGGKIYFGTPAIDARTKYKEISATKKTTRFLWRIASKGFNYF